MKKELGVLLLIFIATVGLSSAASAQPVAQAPQGPTTYGHGGHGTHFGHWVIFRRFVVATPFAVNMIRHRYHPPMFRVTAAYIGHHRFIVTVWRQIYFRR